MGFSHWLGQAAMKPFARALPVMGDTERAALEAGTVGFEGRLFSGRPDFDALLAAGPNVLSAKERAFLDELAKLLRSNAALMRRLCPDLATPAGGGLRDLMDALALAGQLGEETVTLNKAVRRSQSMERAAQASSRPELALAYLRAADRVIQVDDFAP